MITRDRLRLEEACAKIGYSYFMIKVTCEEEWDKQRALASWRMEIFDYIAKLSTSEIKFILNYFKQNEQVIYLEILSMLSQTKYINLEAKPNVFLRIIEYIKGLKKGKNDEKVCSNSTIPIRGNCNIS